MPSPQFTQEDLVRVQIAADKLADDAPKLVGEHPLFALAALTIAACHVALFTETSFTTLMELVSLHYRAAAAGMAAQELEAQLGRHVPMKLDTGEPS